MSTIDDHDVRTTEIHHTLLQRRDGTFLLILWVDGNSHRETVADQTVTVNVQTAARIRAAKPLTESAFTTLAADPVTAFTVAVPDHPLILEITPASNSDLIVTDLTWTPAQPKSGDAVIFSVTAKNQGTDATPAGVIHGVGFFVDGTQVAYSGNSNASLAAGATRTLTASGPADGAWTATAGTHVIKAVIDDTNRIPERSETNNEFSINLMVTALLNPGDLNRDGVVDGTDLELVKHQFGLTTTDVDYDPRADPDGDGHVGVRDLNIVLGNLGR